MRRMMLAAVACVCLAGRAAPGSPIQSRNLDGDGGINHTDVPRLRLVIESTDGARRVTLFDLAAVTNGSYFLDGSSPGTTFGDGVAMLTDGVDDVVNLLIGTPDGTVGFGVGLESLTFHGGSGIVPPDFTGRTILRIGFELERFYLRTPGADPNGDGIWSSYRVFSKLIIDGPGDPLAPVDDPLRPLPPLDPILGAPVPEPSTGLLGLLGGLLTAGWAWRRHRAGGA